MVVVVLTLSFLLVTCNISFVLIGCFDHIGFDCNEALRCQALRCGRCAPCDADAFPKAFINLPWSNNVI